MLVDRDPNRYSRAAARWVARFAAEAPDASLEETQLVAAALAALSACPELARPVLLELVRVRRLITVQRWPVLHPSVQPHLMLPLEVTIGIVAGYVAVKVRLDHKPPRG